MPLLAAVQTPTCLASGERIAVLNTENLGNAAITMAVSLTPDPMPVDIAIVNISSQTVSLVASADGVNFYPCYTASGTAITVITNTVGQARVVGGLYYAVKAGGAITAGTIWLAR